MCVNGGQSGGIVFTWTLRAASDACAQGKPALHRPSRPAMNRRTLLQSLAGLMALPLLPAILRAAETWFRQA